MEQRYRLTPYGGTPTRQRWNQYMRQTAEQYNRQPSITELNLLKPSLLIPSELETCIQEEFNKLPDPKTEHKLQPISKYIITNK